MAIKKGALGLPFFMRFFSLGQPEKNNCKQIEESLAQTKG